MASRIRYVEPSFAPKPTYDEGGQVSTLNGLERGNCMLMISLIAC